MADRRERLADQTGEESRLMVDILLVVAEDGATVEEIGNTVNAPTAVIEEVLQELVEEDIVVRDGRTWRLKE
jgi:predicted transcriptional regulator